MILSDFNVEINTKLDTAGIETLETKIESIKTSLKKIPVTFDTSQIESVKKKINDLGSNIKPISVSATPTKGSNKSNTQSFKTEVKRVETQAKQAKKLLDSIQYNLDAKTYDTKLNVLQSRLDSYAPIGDKYKNAVAAIGDTKNKIEQLNTAMKQQGETAQRAETVKVAYENFTKSIRLAENEMRNLSASQDKVVSPLSLARTNKSFTEYWNKNTKALKKYREQYEAFSTQLANVKTDAEHKKFQLDFADLQTEIVRNGDTGMSITDQLKNSFNRILQFAGIYKIQTYALTMANHTILRFESRQIKIIHT